MCYFPGNCQNVQIGQQPAAQLPWFHIVTLLTKAAPEERGWYAEQAVAEGWSRLTLERHIEQRFHARQGAAVSIHVLNRE